MSVDAQLEVLPGGTHLIANCDGVVLIVAHRADVAATAESPAGQALTALLGLVRQAAATEKPRSGRMFARLATSWLMSLDNEDQVEFGVITPGTTGVALFLHGDVTAVLGCSDRSEVLHGRDAGFTVDRVVIPGPDIGVGLFVDGEGVSEKTLPGRGVARLGAGTVPGSGAVLWFETTQRDARPSASDDVGIGAGALSESGSSGRDVRMSPDEAGSRTGWAMSREPEHREFPEQPAELGWPSEPIRPGGGRGPRPEQSSIETPVADGSLGPSASAGTGMPAMRGAQAPPGGGAEPTPGDAAIGTPGGAGPAGASAAAAMYKHRGPAMGRVVGPGGGAAGASVASEGPGSVGGRPVELRKGAGGSEVGGRPREFGRSEGGAWAGGSAGSEVGARAAEGAGSGGWRRDPELDVDTFVPSVPIPVPVRTVGVVPVVEPEGGGVVVQGFRCSRQHLNDPRVSFCAVCGIRMDQMTCVLTEGVRPPLGLLMLDDGTSFVLDNDIVLGREPEHAEAVRRGARPIRLPDRSGGMSRAHVEIRLVEWDVTVVDQGSANGTYIRMPGHQEWIRSLPNHPSTLAAGAQILLGGRILTFDSQHSQF